MDRYRVEFRINSNDYFRQDCTGEGLEESKKLIKSIQQEEKIGKCYYRKFPISKNKKIYF